VESFFHTTFRLRTFLIPVCGNVMCVPFSIQMGGCVFLIQCPQTRFFVRPRVFFFPSPPPPFLFLKSVTEVVQIPLINSCSVTERSPSAPQFLFPSFLPSPPQLRKAFALSPICYNISSSSSNLDQLFLLAPGLFTSLFSPNPPVWKPFRFFSPDLFPSAHLFGV